MRLPSMIAIVLATGCTPSLWSVHEAEDCESPREARADARVVDDASTGPVILTLRTRDHDVVVHGGDSELRFTVAQADGAVLGSLLDAAAFEKRFPELHRHFESAYAEEGVSADRERIWAGP